MGPGLIPIGARVYCDSSIFIYAIEQHIEFGVPASTVIDRGSSKEIELVSSELAIMESMVRPLRANDTEIVRDFDLLFGVRWLEFVAIDRTLLRAAAALRARHPSLRTPDAIHLATANQSAIDVFLTNDRMLATICGSRAKLLSDFR